MKITAKKAMQFAAGTCAALSLVAIGSVIASGTAVKVMAEGLKAGAAAMKDTVAQLRAEEATSKTQPVGEENITGEDFAN